MIRTVHLFAGCALGMLICTAAQSGRLAAAPIQHYRVAIDLRLGESAAIKLNTVVKQGVQAQWEFKAGGSDAQIRLRVDQAAAADTVRFDASIVRYLNGNWVELANPSVTAILGQSARISVDSGNGSRTESLTLGLQATALSAAELQTNTLEVESEPAPSH